MLESNAFIYMQEYSMRNAMEYRSIYAGKCKKALMSTSVLCLSLFASSSLFAQDRMSYETVANRALRSPSSYESIAAKAILTSDRPEAIPTYLVKNRHTYEIVANEAMQGFAKLHGQILRPHSLLQSNRRKTPPYQETATEAFQQFSTQIHNKIRTVSVLAVNASELPKTAEHVTYLNMDLPQSPPEHIVAVEGADTSMGQKTQTTTVQVPVGNQKQTPTTTKKPTPTSVEGADKATASTHFSLGEKLGLAPKSRIQINGFISAGSSKTNANSTAIVNTPLGPTFVPVTYRIPSHGAIGDSWNFNASSLVGIQITGRITNFLSAVLQLVADGDNTNGNKPYRVKAEWAFIRTQIGHNFQTRAGRFRLPAFLYSETEQVGYTYPWIFLPNEVYRIIPADNINGIDFIYTLPLGNTGWNIEFQPYYGAESSEFDLFTRGATSIGGALVTVPQGKTADFDERNIFGAVISFANPYFLVRGTYIRTQLSAFIPDFVVPTVGEISIPLFNKQEATFYSIGGRMNWHHILFVAEYAHRTTPPQIASLTGYYAMLGVHLGEFLPNITYADIHTTNTNALLSQPVSEFPQKQHSYTLGLAYYINSNIVSKVSVSMIKPSGNGLFNANPGKKTVYLYGFSLDAIF